MCKNITVFAAGVVALSFLGLGSRICIAEMMTGVRIHATCPACEYAFWIAVFAMPLFVGMFVGAFGGERGYICAGMTAITALIVRTYVVGTSLQDIINHPVMIGLSVLYVAAAVAGGVIGSKITSYRTVSVRSGRLYTPKVVNSDPSGATAQSHSHDNLAY